MIITKPPKPSTVVFTTRSKKKSAKDDSEVEFYQPPPTYEERMKQLRVGAGINNFKALKYETRTPAEQKEIEDLIMEKLGTWKFSPKQFSQQVPAVLLDKIKVRWDNIIQIVKDIFGQTLK